MIPARVFAALYDRAMAASEDAGLRDRRAALLAAAEGEVVEIGAGTGLNLAHYGPGVTRLVATEPEAPMARRLRERVTDPRVEVVAAGAEALPFADGSFDVAVSTLVLCTVPDLDASLAEVRRVLRPGGRLLFCEHVRGDGRLGAWQDRALPVWRWVARGCHPNRDAEAAIRRAGFTVERAEPGRLPKAVPLIRPLVQGVAVRP
jgi:SAM-dependent methyltransferase